jgi:putative oxidoreductase
MDASKEETLSDIGKLMLRLSSGGFMLTHGYPKLMAWSTKSATFPDPLGVGSATSLALAIFAEFFCALAVMAGALTRPAVVPLIVTMVVAGFVVHGPDPWGKKEKAVLYLAAGARALLGRRGRARQEELTQASMQAHRGRN